MSLTLSVVTPSFEQAKYLSDCIDSVQSQSYPPIEHLVYDPGSSDGSKEIARSYSGVTLFEETDEGQSDALNKGFARARGDLIAWLNSDDAYADASVFEKVIERFEKPDSPDIVYGRGLYFGSDGSVLREAYVNRDPNSLGERLHHEVGLMHFPRTCLRTCPGDIRLHSSICT